MPRGSAPPPPAPPPPLEHRALRRREVPLEQELESITSIDAANSPSGHDCGAGHRARKELLRCHTQIAKYGESPCEPLRCRQRTALYVDHFAVRGGPPDLRQGAVDSEMNLELARLPHIIRIQEGDVLPSGLSKSAVLCRRGAPMVLRDMVNTRPELSAQPACVVCRSVVDDQDFERGVTLVQRRTNRVAEQVSPIVRWNHDRHGRHETTFITRSVPHLCDARTGRCRAIAVAHPPRRSCATARCSVHDPPHLPFKGGQWHLEPERVRGVARVVISQNQRNDLRVRA